MKRSATTDVREERWFRDLFGLDSRSIALFRVGLGLCLFWDFAVKLTDAEALFSGAGLLPTPLASQLAEHGQWTLFNGFDDPWWPSLLLTLGAALSLGFAAGVKPRWSGSFLWIILMSTQVRNPLILHGGDVLMRTMLFWSLWLPLSQCRLRAGAEHPRTVLGITNAGVMVQLIVVYVFTGLLKTGPEWHGEATAVGLALADFGTPLGQVLAEQTVLTSWLTSLTLAWERWGFLLLFAPLWRGPARTLAVLAFMSFHLGLLLCLELGPFPVQCLVMWLVWLPSWFWSRLGAVAMPISTAEDLPSSAPWPRAQGAVHGALVGLMLLWNIGSLVRTHDYLPKPLQTVVRATGLSQSWRMFAPSPQRLTHAVSFTRSNGTDPLTVIDPRTGMALDTAEEPPARRHGSVRWRKYHYNVAERRFRRTVSQDDVTQPALEWLCRHAPPSTDNITQTVAMMHHPSDSTPEQGLTVARRVCRISTRAR